MAAAAVTAVGLEPLEVVGLSYAPQGISLLSKIDFTIEARGAVTVIMGPNGAGKSLLLRLLNGLLEPSAGQVSWNGHAPDEQCRRRQSFVFQRPVLLRRSVRANVEFVLRLSRAISRRECRTRAESLIRRAGLAGRELLPARQLSGGEQQRLALVCALANDPEVLLLDEPTASLDPASTAAIEAIITDCREKAMTVLLVTHDAGQANRLADDVIFLTKGRLTEHTPADQFFVSPCSAEARAYLDGRLVL